MEAAALARRTRAVEELRRLSSAVAESDDTPAAALARRARAVEELQRLSALADSDDTPAERLSTVAESDDTPTEQECDHFSLRGYVAMMQKKDPKLCSPHIFNSQPQYAEHHTSPVLVSKSHRWDCSTCLDRVKVSGHTATSENASMEQDGMNDGCSISVVRIRRVFSCTQQSSDRLTLSKAAQECNSKCSSPGNKATAINVPAEESVPEALIERSVPATQDLLASPSDSKCSSPGNKTITAMNVPITEENVPEALIERSVPATQDLQASPNNINVSLNILNAASKDVSELPDNVQKVSIIEEMGTQNPQSPNSCVAPIEGESSIAQDVPKDDPNVSNACKPVPGHKGKQISGDKGNHVCNKGPRRELLKRNAGSDGKKKRSKSTELTAISDLRFSQKKPQKTRLLSELIGNDQQVGVSADAFQVDHAHSVDPCEGGTGNMHLEVGKDNDTPNEKVDEIQSRAVKNKGKHIADRVDDGSSLMNWLKSTHKKVRTEKKDSEQKNFDSSAVPNSYPDIVASNDMHHDFLPSVGDVGQEEVPSTPSAHHGNGNAKNDNLGQNMQKVDDLCQNESDRCFSNEKSTILLKRKVLSTSVAHDENIENSTTKREMLRSDDLPQMEPEGSVQRCLAKVSKRKVQNVPGLRKKNIPNNKKKGKQVHEKQNAIDDFPMDIVELLARKQHERQLMIDSNSLENCHTQPKVAQVDCAELAAKDCPISASNELNTNFQKSSQDHASSSTEAANLNQQDLHTQKCHAASSASTEPNGHPPESQMQNSLQVHALPITRSFNAYSSKLPVLDILECAQEQQTQFNRDEEVTIACTSPMFSDHEHIAEVPARSWRDNGENKLMWDSFKTASRNSPARSYGFQFENRLQEADSAPIHAYRVSSNYAAHQPVIVAVDPYTKEAVSLVQPNTALTMGSGRLYDRRIPGQSGIYPKEPMPASHLLRLMDSSSAPGFRNYQRADSRQMELHQTHILGTKFTHHDQYNASPSTSYGSHIIEEVPLTLQDLSRRQVQQNLHRPVRPHPRVGVLGSLLQQDIANWTENCGPQSGYRLGISKGMTPLDMNRQGNYKALNSGMLSAGWNALQLGSATSVANPVYQLPRYGPGQPSTSGKKTVHPLDKLVRKDICVTNRNPADFTVISDKNEYMRSI